MYWHGEAKRHGEVGFMPGLLSLPDLIFEGLALSATDVCNVANPAQQLSNGLFFDGIKLRRS
jgi:hypothetical protein